MSRMRLWFLLVEISEAGVVGLAVVPGSCIIWCLSTPVVEAPPM